MLLTGDSNYIAGPEGTAANATASICSSSAAGAPPACTTTSNAGLGVDTTQPYTGNRLVKQDKSGLIWKIRLIRTLDNKLRCVQLLVNPWCLDALMHEDTSTGP